MLNADRSNRLHQIINDPGSTTAEIEEARRELTGTDTPQADEDAKLLAALDYHVPLDQRRFPPQPAQWERGCDARLKDLAYLLVCDPYLINLVVIANGPSYALTCVADLKALHQRTKSDRVRQAAFDALAGIGKYIENDDAKHEVTKFIASVT